MLSSANYFLVIRFMETKEKQIGNITFNPKTKKQKKQKRLREKSFFFPPFLLLMFSAGYNSLILSCCHEWSLVWLQAWAYCHVILREHMTFALKIYFSLWFILKMFRSSIKWGREHTSWSAHDLFKVNLFILAKDQ